MILDEVSFCVAASLKVLQTCCGDGLDMRSTRRTVAFFSTNRIQPIFGILPTLSTMSGTNLRIGPPSPHSEFDREMHTSRIFFLRIEFLDCLVQPIDSRRQRSWLPFSGRLSVVGFQWPAFSGRSRGFSG